MEQKPLIFSRISAIMAEVEPISKDNFNKQQNYKFRGIDDVYQALQAILAKNKVFTVPEVLSEDYTEHPSKSGGTLFYSKLKIKYTFFAEDGSWVAAVVVGEGMDSGDKSCNKAQSVAHKYALLQVFCIPTEDPKDPENDSPAPMPKTEKPQKSGATEPKSEPTKAKKPVKDMTKVELGNYVPTFGKLKGKKLCECEYTDLSNYADYLESASRQRIKEGSTPTPEFIELTDVLDAWLSLEAQK